MSDLIHCPQCQRQLKAPESMLGQVVACPTCGARFALRAAPPPPPPTQWSSGYPPPQSPSYSRYPSHSPLRPERPGKVQAIAIMMLIGGILAILNGLGFLFYAGMIGVATLGFGWVCCLWPGPYYGVVLGILAIIKASKLLGSEAHHETPPQGIAIMQIINIINFDLPNCVMGIVALVFLSDPEVDGYFRR